MLLVAIKKVLPAGGFNAEISKVCLDSFLYHHELKNLLKEKSFFKNVSIPACRDLFLIKCILSFQNTQTFSTGLSYFQKLALTVFKTTISKRLKGKSY